MGKETIPAKARRTAEIPQFYAAIDTRRVHDRSRVRETAQRMVDTLPWC